MERKQKIEERLSDVERVYPLLPNHPLPTLTPHHHLVLHWIPFVSLGVNVWLYSLHLHHQK